MKSTSDETTWQTQSPQRTRDVARDLASGLGELGAIALVGPLGSGKTTFVKGLVDACGGDGDSVRSPTFSLIQVYEETSPTIIHADLYRTSDETAQRTTGLTEYFGRGLLAVEWAERWTLGWPEDCRTLIFKHVNEETRRIELRDGPPKDQPDRDDDLL